MLIRRLFFTAILAAVLPACGSHYSTLKTEGSTGQMIYAIPEEQAFQIAFSSLANTLPGYEITDIDGPVKGYSALFRFLLDTYTQQVMVIPAAGKDANGRPVNGYYFDVSGRGSSIVQGAAKNAELFDRVATAAKATGKGIAVFEVATVAYSGIAWKQGQIGASNSYPASTTAAKEDAFGKIERLKVMRDRGVITDDEFERKKKDLLDRL
ncbi:SHOCT domain-containing protein [Noviherbaspirillum cavernae]|uniref:SHOCT domain-containing protein n=1 Tax=Noviherbaspirillum cavernae TaxID=2320862 RepID=A0A418X0H9_9BURK|nr:SHOCT domain-containing protein [Noviherbaspirillum cavernae]RJG05990.1 SHOCT domain-containing protein [Noviherbaspirillum cavernae]